MRGFFSRLLGPRWQHSSASVRHQAVARLSIDRVEHRQALEQLALDADTDVRQAALARLDDIGCLLKLRCAAGSHELDERLVWLLSGHAGAPDLAQRIVFLGQLDAPYLLERLAMEADNQQLRMEALAKLDDEAALIRLACDNRIAAVRHAAAARVESDEGLSRLARDARRDGQVMRQARQRLARRRADANQQADANARREQLLAQIEHLFDSAWEAHDEARFEHFESALRELGPGNAEQERRLYDAHQRYRKVLSDQQHLAQAREEARQRQEAASRERDTLLAALEESLANLAQGEGLSDQELALLRSQKQLLSQRWLVLSEQHSPDKPLRERYSAVLERYDSVFAARGRLDAHAELLVQALSDNDSRQLASLFAACRWPQDIPLAPLLGHVNAQLKENEAEAAQGQGANLSAFRAELDRLQHQLDSGQVSDASRLYQDIAQRAEGLDPAVAESVLGRFRRLGGRLAELRDWRAFVAGPKRQQLCDSIEELAEQTSLSDSDLNQRHRQLVQEWKSLADAAVDRALSTRFRRASDAIRERLRPWRERQAQERENNLAARVALCEQLEALLEQPDERADPDALRRIRDSSRQLWQRHSPVPSKQARRVERRFARVRHALQSLIERRASEIATAKRELIEQLWMLRDQEVDAHQRAEKAKAMQQQWRELGRAPKGEEQALWHDFRHLCDEIFSHRDAARRGRQAHAQQRLDDMQELIDRLDAWRPASANEGTALEAAIKQAAALEPLPHGKRGEGMKKRWAGIVQTQRKRLERLALAEEAQHWQQLGRLIESHLTADAALLEKGDALTVSTEQAGLDQPLSADVTQAHERRNVARQVAGQTPDNTTLVESRLTALRVHLALLSHGRVPPEDEPYRLEIQVQRLNRSIGQAPSPEQELRWVLLELLATGPVPAVVWAKESGALDECMTCLTRQVDG